MEVFNITSWKHRMIDEMYKHRDNWTFIFMRRAHEMSEQNNKKAVNGRVSKRAKQKVPNFSRVVIIASVFYVQYTEHKRYLLQ